MNQFLTKIVQQTEGELLSIIIFSLQDGTHLYSSSDPEQNYMLLGDNDLGKALEHFENLKQVKKALDSFGKATTSGELDYSIFRLTKAQVMVYFHNLPDTPVAICFLAFNKTSLGALLRCGRNHIEEIKKTIPHQSW